MTPTYARADANRVAADRRTLVRTRRACEEAIAR